MRLTHRLTQKCVLRSNPTGVSRIVSQRTMDWIMPRKPRIATVIKVLRWCPWAALKRNGPVVTKAAVQMIMTATL